MMLVMHRNVKQLGVLVCACACVLVCHCIATKVFIGKLLATG